MLTSLFYFDYYKPYLIKEDNEAMPASSRPRLSLYSKNTVGKKAVLLNKAYKNDIVEYAGNLSKKIVGFKDMSRLAAQSIDNFVENCSGKESCEDAKDMLSNDINGFVEAYNSAMAFARSQEHSTKLQDFAAEQDFFISLNKNTIKALGVSVDKNGSLNYDETKINGMSEFRLRDVVDGASFVFNEIYKSTRELLTYPLSNHMNFKGLGYYYNYKLGTVQDDTFNIIKSGILVDIAV